MCVCVMRVKGNSGKGWKRQGCSIIVKMTLLEVKDVRHDPSQAALVLC